jgi:hypothetical protein
MSRFARATRWCAPRWLTAASLLAFGAAGAGAQTHVRLEPLHRDLRTVVVGTPYVLAFAAVNSGRDALANAVVTLTPGPGIGSINPRWFPLGWGVSALIEVRGVVPNVPGPFAHEFDFIATDGAGNQTWQRGAVIGNATYPTYTVGVIPHTASCPSGAPLITLKMDDEDSDNASSRSGWTGATISNGNTTFRFCRVDGRQFYPLASVNDVTNHYAVLKLGTNCPSGSTEFRRYFDNQDSKILGAGNANAASSSSGNLSDIDPNTWRENTTLNFCLFKSGSSTMYRFPDIGVRYGVFAASDFRLSLGAGRVNTDDEDSNNKNGFFGDAAGARIIVPTGSDGRNTTLNMALVKPETRPVARCTNSPTSGVVQVTSVFNDAGSHAQPGRTLVSWSWVWSDGAAPANTPGPHSRTFYNYSGQTSTRTYTGTLTVTDNAGESSSATCSVSVSFP